MPKTLRFEITLSDNHVDAIETIKSLLMTQPEMTGITNATTLEQMFCELSNVGLAILSEQMMDAGEYEKYRNEVELGNAIDKILENPRA